MQNKLHFLNKLFFYLKNLIGFKYFLILTTVFVYSCQDSSDKSIHDNFVNSKNQIDNEFSKEMKQKGNEEISVEKLENDLTKMDNELEGMMQEMEEEMENGEKTDSII